MHYFLVTGHGIAQRVGHFPLATEPWVQSKVTSCEVCGGWSGTQTGFLPSFSGISLLIVTQPLLHTNLSPLLRSVIVLTRLRFISVRHLAGYRLKKLVFYILVKSKGGHEVIRLWRKRLIWSKLVVWFWTWTNIVVSFTEGFSITGGHGPFRFHSSTTRRPGHCLLPSTNLRLHWLVGHEFLFLLMTAAFLSHHFRTSQESCRCVTQHSLYFLCPITEHY
jgi:hypothetical protein